MVLLHLHLHCKPMLHDVSECMRHLTSTLACRGDYIHYVEDDMYLDIQRYHLDVAGRGFLAVGTGQGRLGNSKFAEISLYIYGTLH